MAGLSLTSVTEDIIRELSAELNRGITTEVQLVHLLDGIRKLIERDGTEEQYPALMFHCNWVLDPKMDREGAKAILWLFNQALPYLKAKAKLPKPLQNEIDRIFEMCSFHEQLGEALRAYGLPALSENRSDGWAQFLHLYAQVIEDIPLVVRESPAAQKPNTQTLPALQNISKVTVYYETAKETIKDDSGWRELPYKVTWRIFDKEGNSGDVFVMNSFNLTTHF